MNQEQLRRAYSWAPIDLWTVAYTLLSLLILLFRGPVSTVPVLILLSVELAAVLAPRLRNAGRTGAFLGEFYPVLLSLALYTEVGLSNRARGISYDGVVGTWEETIFNGQPSLQWMTEFPHPAVSSIFHLSYLSYYLIVLGTPLAIWFSGRRGPARETILLMMATFYVSYTLFRFFPVAGPRYVFPLQNTPAMQVPIAMFAHKLVAGGSAWGTAFPSSHVAVAFVNAAIAWRCWRRLGLVVWVMAVLLAFGTVYGQFHYAVDALAGAGLAACVLITDRLITRDTETRRTHRSERPASLW